MTNNRSRCHSHVNGWLPMEWIFWLSNLLLLQQYQTNQKVTMIAARKATFIWELQVLLQIENIDAKSDKSMLIINRKAQSIANCLSERALRSKNEIVGRMIWDHINLYQDTGVCKGCKNWKAYLKDKLGAWIRRIQN